MRKPGLRLRVAVAFAAACSLAVGALGIVLYMASERMEEALVDQIVGEELDALVARRVPDAAPASGPNLQYYIVAPGDESRLPPKLRDLPPGTHALGEGREELHVGVRVKDDVRYIVAYDAGAHEERESRFKSLVLAALGTIALATLALGYWLADILTRQVTDLAQRVGHLQPRGTLAPLARPGQDPEVAALAQALDDYQRRIADLIEREQEFTTNASHELRTPLTAIATSCELLLEDPEMPEKARDRVRMIAAAAAQMGEQVQTLLLLAHEEASSVRAEEVALEELVEEAAASLGDEMARKGLALDMAIGPEVVLAASRQALHTVVSNLLRNAVQYTDRGRISVVFRDGVLSVSDTGIGIDPEQLPRVFDRFYRHTRRGEGLGVGLSIVKRICDHYGWRIAARSTPGAGSTFSIAFR